MLALVLTGAVGCVHYVVQVDSIAVPNQAPATTFVLLPGRQEVAANDLQFREFAGYVGRALLARGFRSAASAEQADVAVLLNYGIGPPQTTVYTYSLPIYGQTGGGTSTFNATTSGSGGYFQTSGTINQQPTYGVVGSQTQTAAVTTYFRYLVLDAVDLEAYRRSQAIVPVWKTTITSAGSSGDLRRVFPVLVGAASEYIATNTGHQVNVTLRESDLRVLRIRGQQEP